MSARRRPAAARGPAEPLVVPLPPGRLMMALLALGAGAAAVLAALAWGATGQAQRAWDGLVTLSAREGLVIRHVELEGRAHADRVQVLAAVMEGGTDAMLDLDPAAARQRLQALDWVTDAEVGRRWPDTVVVRLVERRPVAVWQHLGELAVVDQAGEIVPSADPAEFAHLPRLVGADAAREAGELFALLAATPGMAGEVTAAVRVGGRRWDLHFASGETVALPEGAAALDAWQRFAALDRAGLVRGQGFRRFDLRIPDRMVVQLVDGEAKPRPRPMRAPATPPPEGVTI